MVNKDIISGPQAREIQVDKAKIEAIQKLPASTTVKGIKSGFVHEKYWDNILIKKQFHFDEKCEKTYLLLKEKLMTSPIVMELDWDLSFEFICDANDYIVGIVLGY